MIFETGSIVVLLERTKLSVSRAMLKYDICECVSVVGNTISLGFGEVFLLIAT